MELTFNSLTQKLYSFLVENYLGIQTTGLVAPTSKWGVHYTPLPYHVIRRVLDRLSLNEDDVFIDIGCGKGRVVCCACRKPLRKVVGIEINEDLLRLCAANASKVRNKLTTVESLAIPAETYDFANATAIYLYNPFDRPIMDRVFEKIDASYQRRPRRIQVVYANCVHEDSLKKVGWLEKREEWPASRFPAFKCPISFWESMDLSV